MRKNITQLIEGKRFQNTIVTLIVINAIILGMETSTYLIDNYGPILKTIDAIILKIFIIEILLKMFAYRLRFFTRPWCIFDFCVVGIAVIPSTEAFAALRTLRVLRVLKLLSAVPTMRKVIEGLLSAIPGIASVASIMVIFFYVFAVIGTHLYGETFPDWFGSLGNTMFTLFQVMTLESWSMGIVRPVMEQHPNAWAFFILYILVTTFTMLNLFIAIIVNAMHSDTNDSAEESRLEIKDAITKEIKNMEKRLLKEFKEK